MFLQVSLWAMRARNLLLFDKMQQQDVFSPSWFLHLRTFVESQSLRPGFVHSYGFMTARNCVAEERPGRGHSAQLRVGVCPHGSLKSNRGLSETEHRCTGWLMNYSQCRPHLAWPPHTLHCCKEQRPHMTWLQYLLISLFYSSALLSISQALVSLSAFQQWR